MTYFVIGPAPSGYIAAWPTKGQVYFARLNADGRVLPAGEIETPGTSGMRSGLLASPDSEGWSLIGWKHKDVLGWQLYNDFGPRDTWPKDNSPIFMFQGETKFHEHCATI